MINRPIIRIIILRMIVSRNLFLSRSLRESKRLDGTFFSNTDRPVESSSFGQRFMFIHTLSNSRERSLNSLHLLLAAIAEERKVSPFSPLLIGRLINLILQRFARTRTEEKERERKRQRKRAGNNRRQERNSNKRVETGPEKEMSPF